MTQASNGVRLVVVMGVSGVGKTTVGEALARRLQVPYADADSFHSAEAKAKMASGKPLDDADRKPWLERIARWLEQHRAEGGVTGCSALKRSYRDLLTHAAPELSFLHLTGDPELIAERMRERQHHFMPVSLLRSQLEALEPLADDERGVTLDVAHAPNELVELFVRWSTVQARS